MLHAGCGMGSAQVGTAITGGDSQRGKAAIARYGCGSCHTIGGIRSAHGLVGPPLTGFRDRMYVAGILPNTPDGLIHWIREPKVVNPKTAMPQLGVTEQEATDIAAYIYSIP
jgi:cytochrome c